MKKSMLIAAGLILFSLVNAQTLDEIVKKYGAANKVSQMASKQTVKISAKMSMMGMDMEMTMWMKKPNKIKTSTNFGGQEMIQVFDGTKGYAVNPMSGSVEPVEMTPDQVKQILRSNLFDNYLETYMKEGRLTLAGEEAVNGKAAYKIKASIEGVSNMSLFIDKATFLLAKTSMDVNQGGMAITVDSYPSDYKETNGVFLPMKTTTSAAGMEYVVTFTSVEVDIPIDDSVFKIK